MTNRDPMLVRLEAAHDEVVAAKNALADLFVEMKSKKEQFSAVDIAAYKLHLRRRAESAEKGQLREAVEAKWTQLQLI